jgi:predicted membrane-bound spermidine synthase
MQDRGSNSFFLPPVGASRKHSLVKTTPEPAAQPSLSTGLRRYLYLTAAVTGAAIMVVEILGAKMLSPYVGTSHFVWTAQIAVTLIALACGYYVGGRLADRSQNLGWLYWAILGGAAWLALTVVICEPVAYWCLDFNLAVGALLASAILFFVPLALLAITGPFLVRVITASVTGVGGNVGRLTSLGTVGSFVGTLLIGYLMLPRMHNSAAMYLTAMSLVVVCTGYFGFFARRRIGPLVAVLVLVVAAGFSKPSTALRSGVYEQRFFGNSHFGQLRVLDRVEGAPVRYLLNDNLYQNGYDLETKQSVFTFTYMLAGLARAYTTNINDVLCIGMGIGVVPMDFARQGAQVDVVEINPAVVPVATNFFGLEPARLRQLAIDDGRHFLNRCSRQYDVVVLDAFLGDSSPSHLMTKEAFQSMKRVLRPGGTLVINAFADLADGRDFFAASLEKTLKSVFPGVRIHLGGGQVYIAAMNRPEPEFVNQPNVAGIHPNALNMVRDALAHTGAAIPEHGIVLTDDYNPVEYYDAHNRERIRRELAMGARDL